jgi:hypothetical protein
MLEANISMLNLALMDKFVATPVTIGTVLVGIVSITCGADEVATESEPPPPQAVNKAANDTAII